MEPNREQCFAFVEAEWMDNRRRRRKDRARALRGEVGGLGGVNVGWRNISKRIDGSDRADAAPSALEGREPDRDRQHNAL
jgi:hypothetical protein